MLPRSCRPYCLFALAFGLAGCATVVDPEPDFESARASIRATTGIETTLDPNAPVLTDSEIGVVLADGLTLDEALALALMNNRHLQAGFLELGVGRADFVQAGLLKNPSLGLAFLLPSGGGRSRIGADLAESVAELWQLRRRKEIARLGQDQRILDLSRFAGELLVSTKAAYYDVVGARETRLVAEANVGLTKSALAGVHRQVEVGVATKADESLAQSAALNAELAYRQLARAEDIGKQGLAAFLSLGVDLRSVDLTDALPDIDVVDQTEDSLVARSQACRLDVRSARLQVEFAEEQVRLEQSRTIPAASVGLAAERPESGSSTEFLAGVVGSVEIPLFDQNQAQVSRAKYRRDALKKELEALSAEVTAQVRAALDRWTTAQGAAAFAERDVLPQAERNATLARRAYDLGDKTVLAMLASQSLVVQARQNVTNARLEAARALLDLERSIGAPLGVPLRQGNAKPLDRPPE